MKALRLLIGLSVLLCAARAQAQTALGDSDDKTSLVLEEKGAISVNFSDNSAKGGFLWNNTEVPWRFGFEFSGKASNGYSSLFDGEDISPEIGAGIFVGYQPPAFKTLEEGPLGFIRDQWVTLEVGYGRGEYKMIDQDAPLSDQISYEKHDRPSVSLYYNALLGNNILAGISLGYARENNYTDLPKVDAIDVTTPAVYDSTTRTTESKVSGRAGDYKEFDVFQANADFLWVPPFFARRLGLDLFIRYTNPGEGDDAFEPGIGFFVLQGGAPSRIIGGITAQRDAEDDDVKLGFVAGYNF